MEEDPRRELELIAFAFTLGVVALVLVAVLSMIHGRTDDIEPTVQYEDGSGVIYIDGQRAVYCIEGRPCSE